MNRELIILFNILVIFWNESNNIFDKSIYELVQISIKIKISIFINCN